MTTKNNLVFKVVRNSPELISPSTPTPREYKELSDIDDQESLRFQIPVIQFYKSDGSGREPAQIIRKAIGKALVAYYPLTGRLREKEGRKLVVDCNEEGIMFIEARVNVSVDDFGDALQPPFPGLEELLFDVPGTSDVLNTPLILIQCHNQQSISPECINQVTTRLLPFSQASNSGSVSSCLGHFPLM